MAGPRRSTPLRALHSNRICWIARRARIRKIHFASCRSHGGGVRSGDFRLFPRFRHRERRHRRAAEERTSPPSPSDLRVARTGYRDFRRHFLVHVSRCDFSVGALAARRGRGAGDFLGSFLLRHTAGSPHGDDDGSVVSSHCRRHRPARRLRRQAVDIRICRESDRRRVSRASRALRDHSGDRRSRIVLAVFRADGFCISGRDRWEGRTHRPQTASPPLRTRAGSTSTIEPGFCWALPSRREPYSSLRK